MVKAAECKDTVGTDPNLMIIKRVTENTQGNKPCSEKSEQKL